MNGERIKVKWVFVHSMSACCCFIYFFCVLFAAYIQPCSSTRRHTTPLEPLKTFLRFPSHCDIFSIEWNEIRNSHFHRIICQAVQTRSEHETRRWKVFQISFSQNKKKVKKRKVYEKKNVAQLFRLLFLSIISARRQTFPSNSALSTAANEARRREEIWLQKRKLWMSN